MDWPFHKWRSKGMPGELILGMTSHQQQLPDQLEAIFAELQQSGLCRQEAPAWVHSFQHQPGMDTISFEEWLQFIYLPNCLQQKKQRFVSIVPQAIRYANVDIKKGRLLQLLIELDAMI